METLEVLYKLGPFISGISLFLGAAGAWVTAFKFTRRAMEANWVEAFRRLYGDFWNDEDAALVRSWIASDKLYAEKLEPILGPRMENWKDKKNFLNQDDYAVIEKIDKFCALLVRMEFFNQSTMTRAQRTLWKNTYGAFWTDDTFWISKIRQRDGLSLYIFEFWPPLRTLFPKL